jgi:beta-phosphoglucomutase-like phosphatase (HAD superfamily)
VTATLFDFDGVLVDSEPLHLAAFNDVLERWGRHIDPRMYVERYLSLDDAGVFRSVLGTPDRPVDASTLDRLIEAKSARVMEHLASHVPAYSGATEIVARRATLGPVGIVSGALRREIALALERMGVLGFVGFVVSAESTAMSKPHPAPYLAALEELRRRDHRGTVVAIEDSIGGIQSAKSAGLRCVAVAHTYEAAALAAAGADDVAPDLSSLSDSLIEGRL